MLPVAANVRICDRQSLTQVVHAEQVFLLVSMHVDHILVCHPVGTIIAHNRVPVLTDLGLELNDEADD